MPDNQRMGDRIRYLREVKNLSQAELGAAIGVTKAAVSHWENSKNLNVRLETVIKLCDVLGCDLQYLVHGPGRGAHAPRLLAAPAADSKNRPK